MIKKLCECGCGNPVAKEGNKFINGHNRKFKPDLESTLCECGCGDYANPGKRFILGHNNKGMKVSDEIKQKQSEAHKNISNETRQKMSESGKNKPPITNKTRAKLKDAAKNRSPMTDETKEKIAEAHKNHVVSTETRTKMRESRKNRIQPSHSDETKRKISASHQGITYDEWESFVSNSLYCPAFNEDCKESNREKYGRRCFLTNLPESDNITSTGKQQKLSVHHINMDKMQGCNGKKWKLIPVCLGWHGKIHNDLWEARIIWLLNNVWWL